MSLPNLKEDAAPTLRSLAKTAGVSPMAVSLALRDRPGVAPATRRRLLKLAEESGYQPDPAVSNLMRHLRTRRRSRLRTAICALASQEHLRAEGLCVGAILEGARRRADALGFTFSILDLDHPATPSPDNLRRTLIQKGVTGVLLPAAPSQSIDRLLDGSGFSIVAASLSTNPGPFHRIAPNHFENTRTVIRKLFERGCRRIGMVTTPATNARDNHGFTGAMAWHNVFRAEEPVEPFLSDQPFTEELDEWFARYRPDAIVTHSEDALAAIADGLGFNPAAPSVALASISVRRNGESTRFAGIDENPRQIGRASVDVLARLIQGGEKGPSPNPSVTLINGVWVDGPPAFSGRSEERGAGTRKKRSGRTQVSDFRIEV